MLQDPTVFEGTIRFNIDPFDEFPDARLWEAVQSVQLMPYIRTLPDAWTVCNSFPSLDRCQFQPYDHTPTDHHMPFAILFSCEIPFIFHTCPFKQLKASELDRQ